MQIPRRFTVSGTDPFSTVEWTRRASRISNPDGSVVFEMPDAEVPASWTQLATDIMVSKYFRKAGVPVDGGPNGITDPAWEAEAKKDRGKGKKKDATETGPERSARQVIHRLAGCWRHWGETHGYFDTAEDAQAFEDELKHMMVHQMVAPNSPQWFNTGLNWAYGINGPAQGHYYADPATGQVRLSEDSYTHPQPHACFIQSVDDDLVNPGGIMDLWVREARLFKYGSGTGTNFSRLRGEGERLSGGGKSSGLMSWLKIGDRAAGAIKSGGTTRRAAKMVCLDMDHPDIEKFINWKVREELKVAALVEGMKRLDADKKELAAELGLTLNYDFNGEAYYTVSGQNANNSVRISDAFFKTLDAGEDWTLYNRLPGPDGQRGVAGVVNSKKLWDQICRAAWRCADPGVQYDTTINAWHTCPNSGRINASNPCSEYMFLDNTACNLASLNLLKFYDAEKRSFDVERYEHAIDLWTIVLEISVLMAQYPSEEIARLSYEYRTLGLGYANIGAMLMQAGIAYDSEEARAVCGSLTSILTGRSYRMSAIMAEQLGPFPGYSANREPMLRVMRNHRRAAAGIPREAGEWENLPIRPVPIDHGLIKSGRINIANAEWILARAVDAWDEAVELGEKHGYRNAQTTVIAPTGTIGLLMDCDTTGVEPDFALVKFKKLAGGGYFKIANNSLEPALKTLGYDADAIADILRHVLGALHLDVIMPDADGQPTDQTFAGWLRDKGFTDADLDKVRASLKSVFELHYAFNAWSLGDEALQRLGLDPAAAKADFKFNLLKAIGLSKTQRDILNRLICGTQTVEGAPHILDEHLPVFDCANKCGQTGTRYITAEGHIRMMAAAQPFISGAISKTINLPNEATEQDIDAAYRLSWELGLKANALYRDGSKLSQPLSSKADAEEEEENEGAEHLEKSAGSTRKTASPAATEAAVLAADDDGDAVEDALLEIGEQVVETSATVSSEDFDATVRIVERIIHRPMRRRLPDTRRSLTHKFSIGGHEGYLTVGVYDDGSPGELFITMSKEGSTVGGLMDSLGTAVSVALQYGVPVEQLVRKFAHQRFEPAGMTKNRDIPIAKSLVDYIFRWLGMEFVPGYRDEAAPKRSADDSTTMLGDAKSAPSTKPRAAGFGITSRGQSALASELATDRHIADRPLARAHNDRHSDRTTTRTAATFSSQRTTESTAPDGAHRTTRESTSTSVLSESMSQFQEDAPACSACGTITIRSGACYVCQNCGASNGCS
ncbi:MAG: adenosylcobalamin-dependent ribonucleoside-diphosphate reductase [Phycisphaerales bacterium]